MSKNPLYINNQGSMETKLNALINVVNLLTNQMYYGRVKQAQSDISGNKVDINLLEDKSDLLDTQLTDTQLALCDSYEESLLIGEQLTDTQLALCDVYEDNIELEQQITDTQLALCDVYELILGGTE